MVYVNVVEALLHPLYVSHSVFLYFVQLSKRFVDQIVKPVLINHLQFSSHLLPHSYSWFLGPIWRHAGPPVKHCTILLFSCGCQRHLIHTAEEAHKLLPASVLIYNLRHHWGLHTYCLHHIFQAGGAACCWKHLERAKIIMQFSDGDTAQEARMVFFCLFTEVYPK